MESALYSGLLCPHLFDGCVLKVRRARARAPELGRDSPANDVNLNNARGARNRLRRRKRGREGFAAIGPVLSRYRQVFVIELIFRALGISAESLPRA